MKELGSNNWVEVPANLSEADGSTKYVIHSNPAIDIAVLQLNGDFINRNNLEFPAFDIDKNAMSSSELLENGFDDGSFIYMLGFPMGLVVKGHLAQFVVWAVWLEYAPNRYPKLTIS